MSRRRSQSLARTVPQTNPPSLLRGYNILPVALLVALISAAYAPLFSNSFIDYDDPDYITRNPHITSGLTLDAWSWAWTSTESSNWHPLTWISHAVDVEIYGLNPAGHHFTSLFIHGVNAVLLFFLLLRATANLFCSFLTAAVFGVHPLMVESVAWAAERKNVLCTLFFLLAIAAHASYARQPSLRRYLWIVLAFALGLSSKPMAITLPFVLLLVDFWPLGRVRGYSSPNTAFPVAQSKLKDLVIEKLPLLAMSAGSAVLTFVAQSSAGAVASTSAVPISARMANAVHSYFLYVIHVFWPLGLVPFYPQVRISGFAVLLCIAFVIVVTAVVWRQRRECPYLLMGWLFYLGTLVPVIGLVQVGTQAMADRYMYIPILGLLIGIVWFVDDFAGSHNGQRPWRLLSALALGVLVLLTWRQVSLWHDDLTLWSYNLKQTPDNVVAEDNLGIALLQQGRTGEALPHFYHASELDPGDAISAVNVATDLLANGKVREAIAKYEAALPNAAFVPMLLPNIHSNLGSAFLSIGDLEHAREHYQQALSLNPEDRVARAGLQK